MLQDGRWYAIQVKSKFEKVVAQTLAGRGYDQFLPLASSRRQWSDRVKTLEAPLIPGHVLFRIVRAVSAPVATVCRARLKGTKSLR